MLIPDSDKHYSVIDTTYYAHWHKQNYKY